MCLSAILPPQRTDNLAPRGFEGFVSHLLPFSDAIARRSLRNESQTLHDRSLNTDYLLRVLLYARKREELRNSPDPELLDKVKYFFFDRPDITSSCKSRINVTFLELLVFPRISRRLTATDHD